MCMDESRGPAVVEVGGGAGLRKKVEEGVFLTLYKILPAASCACMAHAVWMYGENTYSISPSFGA